MDRDIHTDPLVYQTMVQSEGLHISEATVNQVINLQHRYMRQDHSIDFCDFLLDDEAEVMRRIDEAESYLLTLTARRSYEDRI